MGKGPTMAMFVLFCFYKPESSFNLFCSTLYKINRVLFLPTDDEDDDAQVSAV